MLYMADYFSLFMLIECYFLDKEQVSDGHS